MVHGQLIAEGKVQKLTYRQLRSIEKIDAKKVRDQELLGLARDATNALGRAAQGLFSNQIAGTAAFILAATTLYPAWQPIVYNSLATAAADISKAWKDQIIPDVTQTVDTIVGRSQGGSPAPPQDNQPPVGTIGFYGIAVVSNGSVVAGRGIRWYTNAASRDIAYGILQIPGVGAAYGDLWPNGPGTGYEKVHQVWTRFGSFGEWSTVPD